MEADDETLALFDLNWFRRLILRRNTPPPSPDNEYPSIFADYIGTGSLASEPFPTLILRRHRRSRSDELAPSPAILIQTPKIQTILSRKITTEYSEPFAPAAADSESRERRLRPDHDRRGAKSRRKKGGSKSLSDLEFEELKGFMDLGFTFSDAEATNPWLISILPGLQRLKAADGNDSPAADSSSVSEATEEISVSRPYLSEAWETEEIEEEEEEEEEERGRVLRNWRIPVEGGGVDMKDHLRFWAHAVASAVR